MTFKTRLHNLLAGLKLTDWIIALFTAILAIVAVLQYREIKNGGKDTHTLAEQAVLQSQAALAQASISQQTFNAVFHPTIEVSSITFNQKAITDSGVVSYTLKNVGSAPAERLSVHVSAIIGVSTKDLSPMQLPSELGVGATFTDAPQITWKAETVNVLDGNSEMKLSFTILYAAHGQALLQRCTTYVLEPSRREMVPVGECK